MNTTMATETKSKPYELPRGLMESIEAAVARDGAEDELSRILRAFESNDRHLIDPVKKIYISGNMICNEKGEKISELPNYQHPTMTYEIEE